MCLWAKQHGDKATQVWLVSSPGRGYRRGLPGWFGSIRTNLEITPGIPYQKLHFNSMFVLSGMV
jgi:hypothetical protein